MTNLLLGILIGYAAAMLAFFVRGRKLPAFPVIPIQVYVQATAAPQLDGANVALPPMAPVRLDHANVVTQNGNIAYHGPDEEHAMKVETQLLARENPGKIQRLINGIEQPRLT